MLSKKALSNLRNVMNRQKINIYVLPRTDEHQSQYLTPSEERVKYLSGFSGSNAVALISQKQALLWTDGRYFLQAQKQLSSEWSMRKLMQGQKKWFQYILQNYKPGQNSLSIDAKLITAKQAIQKKKLFEDKKFQIKFNNQILVDQIWQNRPTNKMQPIFSHQNQAGKFSQQKVEWVRGKIKQNQGEGAIFNQLSEIAWILNLRSSQIPYNPFFKANLIITKDNGSLYLPKQHPSFNDNPINQHLKKLKLQIKDKVELGQKLLCQTNQINYQLYNKIKNPIQWDGIGLYRAVRTQKQIQGFRQCHILDGIAMAQFWAWRSKLNTVNQYEAACYLDQLRKQQQGNMGTSFATISGGGPNGAIIHYHATKQNSATVTNNMIHLVDSGGQYKQGTTDVTRAFHFGSPTAQQKDAYTRVLLGNLDIQRLKWPKKIKIKGCQIQILARRHLWKKGLDYAHGTGHGVGYFGGVHEGPVGISRINNTVLQPNMIVTNEPGYYKDGYFGIRIQNMLVVKQCQDNLLGFQNLTLCPYDKNLFDLSLLTRQDVNHINQYHQKVWQTLSTKLNHDKNTCEWLKSATSPINMI